MNRANTERTRHLVRGHARWAVIAVVVATVGGWSVPDPVSALAAPSPLWSARYLGPAKVGGAGRSIVVTPDGTKVIVTGESWDGSPSAYATVAYATATGARLWAAVYNGPGAGGGGSDEPLSVAVTPDGKKVIVTGGSRGVASGSDYATVAYNTANGAQQWVARYNGPGNGADNARSVAVTPDGATAVVTGDSMGKTSSTDYATVAYDIATGTKKWVTRYNGPANGDDRANAVIVSPDGTKVVVTGESQGKTSDNDMATVAYDTATGTKQWVARYNGPANQYDGAFAAVVTPNGANVIVTGASFAMNGLGDAATVAYDTATGARQWVARYDGPANGDDEAVAIAVTPDGGKVIVTGDSPGKTSSSDYATVAYDTATGTKQWVARYNGPGNSADYPHAIAMTADGTKVVTAGSSEGATRDYAIVAYDVATGTRQLTARYNGPRGDSDVAYAVAVTPDGNKVFATGESKDVRSQADYTTVAYTL